MYSTRLLIVFLISLFIISCSTNDDTVIDAEENLTIELNSELVITLGNYLTEGNRIITRQPKSFQTSELRNGYAEKNITGQVYVYKPKNDFTGNISVEITTKFSNGDSNYKSSTKRYNITVN